MDWPPPIFVRCCARAERHMRTPSRFPFPLPMRVSTLWTGFRSIPNRYNTQEPNSKNQEFGFGIWALGFGIWFLEFGVPFLPSPSRARCIGILTSGGDCPGLNAAIRGVAKPALSDFHIEVIGIEKGFRGLVENHSR